MLLVCAHRDEHQLQLLADRRESRRAEVRQQNRASRSRLRWSISWFRSSIGSSKFGVSVAFRHPAILSALMRGQKTIPPKYEANIT
jgi:hypothetical protein